MADAMRPDGAPQRALDLILSTCIAVISRLVPDWQPPNLEHPFAKRYADALEMRDDIVPGDQIMVMAPSGYWHHGIYVGEQRVDGSLVAAVVDFWGEGADKERCRIAVRRYSKFAAGAAGCAKAAYPPGAALEQSVSAQLAVAFAEHVSAQENNPIQYDLVLRNCEVFATICRCLRWAASCHAALCETVETVAAPMPARKRSAPRFTFK